MIEKNVTLCGQFATGYRDGKVIPATHAWRKDMLYTQGFRAAARTLHGLTVSLVHVWAHGYFHWITECLTMLCRLPFDEISNIFIPSHSPGFVMQSLTLLGLQERVMKWDGTPTLVTLLFDGPQRVNGYSVGDGLERVRSRFRRGSGGDRKTYISREDASIRHVLNEQDVPAKFPGFEKILASRMTFEQQLDYFGGVGHIAGPHGAGLTNMLWTHNAKVTELCGKDRNPCFERLAGTLGLEYRRVPCNPSGLHMSIPRSVRI